jgi:hypothetical protein
MEELNYKVRYKGISEKNWKTINGVINDGLLQENNNIRFFTKKDGSRIELYIKNMVIEFGPERTDLLRLQHEARKNNK